MVQLGKEWPSAEERNCISLFPAMFVHTVYIVANVRKIEISRRVIPI